MKYLHPHYVNIIFYNITKPWYNFWGYLKAHYWRVEIGNQCSFRGFSVFRTLPHSRIKIGDNCIFNSSKISNLIGVKTPCIFSISKRGGNIVIGNNCGFSGTIIRAASSIRLGNNVRCGSNTVIYDNDGHSNDPRSGSDKPIMIGNNVWLGYGVKVLKGVTIGENSLIGAGSIVTKDIPANVVAAGNPCRVIKQICYVE